MALTELQLPTKTDLYNNLQAIAGEIVGRMLRWQEASEFLAKLELADLDALGIAAGQVRTDLVNFRTALDQIVSVYNGEAVTPTLSPAEVMDAVRRMLVI